MPRLRGTCSASSTTTPVWRSPTTARSPWREDRRWDDGRGEPLGAADRPDRPDGADLPHHGLLRRPPRGARPAGGGQGAPGVRGRVPGEQGDRGQAVLASARDGRRVPGRGDVRYAEGRGGRELPDSGGGRRRGARRGGGRRPRDDELSGGDPPLPGGRGAERE